MKYMNCQVQSMFGKDGSEQNTFGFVLNYFCLYMCVKGGKVEPVTTVSDSNALSDGDFSVSVTVSSESAEHFVQKLQQINHLTLRNRLVYAQLMVKFKICL